MVLKFHWINTLSLYICMQAKQLHLKGNMEAKRKGTLAKRLSVAANISYPVTAVTCIVTGLDILQWSFISGFF